GRYHLVVCPRCDVRGILCTNHARSTNGTARGTATWEQAMRPCVCLQGLVRHREERERLVGRHSRLPPSSGACGLRVLSKVHFKILEGLGGGSLLGVREAAVTETFRSSHLPTPLASKILFRHVSNVTSKCFR